jgi:hypothetical protein
MARLGKWLVLVLAMGMLVLGSSTAFASQGGGAPSPSPNPPLAITLSGTVSGDTVTFTAVTEKMGSSFADYWTGATKVETVQSGRYYVSTATFSTAGLADGRYTVDYQISMKLGKTVVGSGRAWAYVQLQGGTITVLIPIQG